MNRRDFVKTAGAGCLAASLARGGKNRNLQVGHTGITWVSFGPGGGKNPGADPSTIERTFQALGGLRFYGLELFSWQIAGMEQNGGLARYIEKYNLPLISAYGGPSLLDASKRRENIADCLTWARLLKKYNGRVVTIGPNGVPRASYHFQEHKAEIIATLNEFGKALG